MSSPDVLVHTELDGETYLVGYLWIRENRRGTFGATFQYADLWLEKKESYAVDPLLPIVSPGPYHKERLFGAIADSAPDRWGRTLMGRAERLRAREESRAPRHLREHVALTMAREAGIRVAESALLTIAGEHIILLTRFDRDGEKRTPFLSAMSLLDGVDQEPRSYLEIAEVIRRFGAQARADLSELWRRILFNILVSNTDDHLRNHGFLYAGRGGWTLSPAYDLNPVPVEVKPRFLSTAIGEDPNDTSASLLLALEVAEYFHLSEGEARSTAFQVAQVTRHWADRAQSLGIRGTEIDFMSSAFDHDDLALALSFA